MTMIYGNYGDVHVIHVIPKDFDKELRPNSLTKRVRLLFLARDRPNIISNFSLFSLTQIYSQKTS